MLGCIRPIRLRYMGGEQMITVTLPFAWGFRDGCHGESVYTGYHLFIGSQLTEYKRGWAAGQQATDSYVPFQNPELYRDVLPAEQRDDWIGD